MSLTLPLNFKLFLLDSSLTKYLSVILFQINYDIYCNRLTQSTVVGQIIKNRYKYVLSRPQ